MLTPGTVLQGRYRVVRQLGQGGMGTVYEALDERLDTTVALKETFFADERLRKQFEREARLLARLHHPALPRVSDHFSEGDGQFLVMQYIAGDDLAEMMTQKRGPFPADQVLTWADQLLDALDYLHTQDPQIVHRDIKPQNLKLTSRGQVILLDFGLAKGQAGEISRVTTSASIFGYTPNYAPLEQIQGLGTDSRSDLYSLAATIYHLLTAVKPPDALTRAAALVNAQPDPLQPASQHNPAVANEIDNVLQKAMAQNREQRFSSAAEMRKALKGTDQATTVSNRAEAQTVLFPPVGRTVAAASTVAAPGQPTVTTGDTTVVRRDVASQKRRVLPWAIGVIGVAALALCAMLYFAMQKSRPPVVQVALSPSPAPAPSPESAPATAVPENTNTQVAAKPNPTSANKQASAVQPASKKTERAATTIERRTTPPPAQTAPRTGDGHSDRNTAETDLPDVPDVEDVPNRRRQPPRTKVLPGGAVIRNFPDGSRLIISPDGKRVFQDKNGRTQILYPGEKPIRPNPKPPQP
ncbi:MAG TPA: protein kinase [Pyrinomonadaceae bacterium]|nr:protein kinase [Pyrinomonadaceae bacterium]